MITPWTVGRCCVKNCPMTLVTPLGAGLLCCWLHALMLGLEVSAPKWRKLSSSNEEIRVGGRIYRGSGTVWNEYPSGRRCSTDEEEALTEIAQRECWKIEVIL